MKKNEETGGEFGEYPNDKWRQFFDKFSEIDTLKVNEWKPVHLLSYFCKKYQEHYNVKYNFKFNSPSPPKSFEVFQIKRMGMLLSSQPTILKEYIDWIYENKVVQAKRRLTSISFMTHEDVIKEYKMNVLLAENKTPGIDRSIPLPAKYKEVFLDGQVHANTYGDVAFLAQMDPMPENIAYILGVIEQLGFDMEVLKRIV